jgi:hypothetical protein
LETTILAVATSQKPVRVKQAADVIAHISSDAPPSKINPQLRQSTWGGQRNEECQLNEDGNKIMVRI